jgi:hypothetical protein
MSPCSGQRIAGSRAVTNASNAITSGWRQVPLGELDGLAGAPAVRAWESRTGPEAQAQLDSSACEVKIAAHHAPRRLELQRKLEELLHAPDRHAVGQRPDMRSARHRRALARTTHVRARPGAIPAFRRGGGGHKSRSRRRMAPQASVLTHPGAAHATTQRSRARWSPSRCTSGRAGQVRVQAWLLAPAVW